MKLIASIGHLSIGSASGAFTLLSQGLVSIVHLTYGTVLVVVAPISSTAASSTVSGRPRQFCVMWQNSRCLILFLYDVPGG